jgi:hypothetical protein
MCSGAGLLLAHAESAGNQERRESRCAAETSWTTSGASSYSHLSLAFASAVVCHGMLSGASTPPRLSATV